MSAHQQHDLDWYSVERCIHAPGSKSRSARDQAIAQWARIADWQRQGLVRLRWDDALCYVGLTDAGWAMVERDKAT